MKYVVIEVAEDVKYEALIIDEEQVHTFANRDIKIVGVFKVPTQYCDPTDGHRGKKTEAGWTRGKKYGWWVCGACKKPTEAWSKNLNAVLSSAKNLLAPNHILGAAPPVTGQTTNV